MPRKLLWCLAAAVFVGPAAVAQPRPADTPDQATLKRLAQQLGTGSGMKLPENIDPELLKLAAEYLKKNPDLLKDPAFQQQVKQLQEQAKQDPKGFAEQLKKQNPQITPEQIESLKQQFKQPSGGPGKVTPPKPQPNGDPPSPNGDPLKPPPPTTPPPGQPWQPPQPNGQPGTPPPSSEQKAANKEGYQQVVGMWENNFGDIDDTPALKKSLVEMFSGEGKSPWGEGGGNGWDGPNGGKSDGGKNPWDGGGNGGSQSGFVNWLKTTTSGGGPSWWKNMTGGNNSLIPPPSGGSNWSPPPSAGGGGIGGVSVAGGGPLLIVLAVLAVLAVVGFVAWRYWPQIQALRNGPKPVGGLGPWTIDPRDVKDRDTLVKAFDYLSVLICGDGARVWNHQTISEAFRDNVPGAAPFATQLARLYALARYSPANEPITQADIAEARGYLCRLAGVTA